MYVRIFDSSRLLLKLSESEERKRNLSSKRRAVVYSADAELRRSCSDHSRFHPHTLLFTLLLHTGGGGRSSLTSAVRADPHHCCVSSKTGPTGETSQASPFCPLSGKRGRRLKKKKTTSENQKIRGLASRSGSGNNTTLRRVNRPISFELQKPNLAAKSLHYSDTMTQ